uniref:Isoamyl alcohol oxidase n=1 Tax=Coccidioides posadasii RMSCC 3488 TaxID=454284 RepID=A0A0J6FAN4_COCPO|nr:isoamyl alcohol oxidase [Coccidioides posadasii RMSCC 3488]
MKTFIHITAFSFSFLGAVHAVPSRSHCRCTPSDGCWPSAARWKALNESIDGNLVALKPVGNVCHDPTFDENACAKITAMQQDSVWRSQVPGAVQYINWETWPEKEEKCYIDMDRKTPCGQGQISEYSAAVQTPKHVQNAVRFAATHNLRLAVKNTGHCFLGRSVAPESLQIFTHQMKDIKFTDEFVPKGKRDRRAVGSAVTIGAGVQLSELYKATTKENKVVVAGFAHTVGAAGGYIQGGGHSALGPWKGMAVDNVLEFNVVTAKGEHITANDYQNQDLFWALRGGGGGTFGVVTDVTLRTFTDAPLVSATLNITQLGNANDSYWDGIERLHARLPALSDEGGSGYYFMVPNVQVPGIGQAAGAGAIFFFANNDDTAKIDEAFAPLLSSLGNIPGLEVSYASEQLPGSKYVLEGLVEGSDQTGVAATLGSRLVSRKFLEGQTGPSELVSVLKKLKHDSGAQILGNFVAGGQVAKNKDVKVSLNPAWRRALVHLIFVRGWDKKTTFAEQRAIQSNVTNVEVPMFKKLEPDMGAYTNEADPYEKDFQESFWGENYPRLYELKKKWDPKSLFIVRSGVGSEDWDEYGLCRVRGRD